MMEDFFDFDGLKKFISRGMRSGIGKNVMSLYLLQFGNYLLPLITVPYLVRVLGPDKYGVIAFGQGFISYLLIVVNYGFDWSATRKISVLRDDQQAIGKICSNVFSAKFILFGAGGVVLFLATQTVGKLGETSTLLFVLYGVPLGYLLFPTWLFQGLEKMVTISVINIVARTLGTILLFIVIRSPDDYLLYGGLISAQSVAAGALGFWYALRHLHIRLTFPTVPDLKAAFKEGWTLFLSTGAVSLYTSGNAFILGMLTNHAVVGYYSAGEKLVRTVVSLLDPISQAVYPRISKLVAESKARAKEFAKRLLIVMAIVGSGFMVAVLLFAPIIGELLLGSGFLPSVPVMRILSLLPLLVAVSNVFGIQIMLPFGHDKVFMYILFGASAVNITLAIVFAPIWLASGMALAVVLSELFVTLAMLLYLDKVQLNPFRKQPAGTTIIDSTENV